MGWQTDKFEGFDKNCPPCRMGMRLVHTTTTIIWCIGGLNLQYMCFAGALSEKRKRVANLFSGNIFFIQQTYNKEYSNTHVCKSVLILPPPPQLEPVKNKSLIPADRILEKKFNRHTKSVLPKWNCAWQMQHIVHHIKQNILCSHGCLNFKYPMCAYL